MSSYIFTWPKGPQEVIVTGTFDNWGKTLPLVKKSDGSFELTFPLPAATEKILFKYVVDGEWLVSQDQPTTKDATGIENNYVDSSLATVASSKSVIPESGLPIAAAAAVAGGVAATVLPKEEPSHPSIFGEPGIVIPKNAETIEAFKTISDVDPKSLNGASAGTDITPELSAEEKKKQKKKVKKSKYKAKKKAQKVGESDEGTPEPESISPEPEAAKAAVEEPKESKKEEIVSAATGAAAAAGITAASTTSEAASAAPAAPEAVAAAKEAVAASEVTAPEAKEVVAEVPEVKEAAVAAAAPVAVHTLDPKAHEAEVPEPTVNAAVEEHQVPSTAVVEPEVHASPVAAAAAAAPATTATEEDEEIVITQGISNPEQAIAAAEGDVIVEEIKPAASEAARLKKEANIPTEDTTPVVAKVKATPAPAKKEELKKKSSFFSKLKKIFK